MDTHKKLDLKTKRPPVKRGRYKRLVGCLIILAHTKLALGMHLAILVRLYTAQLKITWRHCTEFCGIWRWSHERDYPLENQKKGNIHIWSDANWESFFIHIWLCKHEEEPAGCLVMNNYNYSLVSQYQAGFELFIYLVHAIEPLESCEYISKCWLDLIPWTSSFCIEQYWVCFLFAPFLRRISQTSFF